MNVLVTGATGFLGTGIITRLSAEESHSVTGAVRRAGVALPGSAPSRLVGELSPNTDWRPALEGIDVVVHCAARVHIMRDRSSDPLAAFRLANVGATQALARQAAAAGVRRLVYISSIKVNGEATEPGRPFTTSMPPAPRDPYGISKMEAEVALRALANRTGIEVVIIRPVLVYGPGVKGNFAALLRLMRRGLPLPLGAIHNRRSLVGLDNLVDLIVRCLDHPRAANETFLVSDGEDLSTTELVRRMAQALDRPPRLLPAPEFLLAAAGHFLGHGDLVQRLIGTLQVDIATTRTALSWAPPLSVDEGLRRAVGARR